MGLWNPKISQTTSKSTLEYLKHMRQIAFDNSESFKMYLQGWIDLGHPVYHLKLLNIVWLGIKLWWTIDLCLTVLLLKCALINRTIYLVKKGTFDWDIHFYVNESEFYKYFSLVIDKSILVVELMFFRTVFYTVLF